MVNLFKLSIRDETLTAWAKISDDITKVAILTVPVILYDNNFLEDKIIRIGLLLVIICVSLYIGIIFRNAIKE
ncbi:hypothetical protein QJU43_07540 [Pasteurella atlantica]|uniref:hypothetical protein n=1 Tax=Pasteurellaceae TaxID=712 RepID=UPI00275C8112|nr:hypothetical protein [Pasteurella atlantica]MDP8034087.1 hypothetical protein [Pasteurella atlantica]MDP8036007.1 hypothetical protein [Pasteurella atlantica]MDP8037957.1 hypothetical protein [Pasteurella atlantica]MDP8048325.1 hypothetical protein [Pasteurella atlantica]MDP8050269.1 hypothetical protein [Pasteurella atlantica]